jgi:AP-2 complex subunit mu-1
MSGKSYHFLYKSLCLFFCSSRLVTEAFRLQVIGGKDVKGPVVIIDRTSYLYIRKGNVYIVAVTKTNSHAGAIFEVLYKLIHVFESYFGAQFDENSIRNNFVVIYELLDGN